MIRLDATHDPQLTSWVSSANGHSEFPIQNLPLGVFSTSANPARRCGIAIGDAVFDVEAATAEGLLTADAARAADLSRGGSLNALLAANDVRISLRAAVSAVLRDGAADRERASRCLHRAVDCTMHLPASIGDYTDFYAGIHHAMNVGKLFRPDNPLLPNYKFVPIGYHGRSSSIRVSGEPVQRPCGQRKPPADPAPSFGACRNLDFELELGIWIGKGNASGKTVPIAEAADHIAGLCLLNDWSARDIQSWEYQPLGPFLAKNFATSVSAWIVTAEALAPFRAAQAPRESGDPAPLPYLLDAEDQSHGAFDIELEVLIETEKMRAAQQPAARVSLSNAQHLYWTAAQLVAHHASNGCNLQPGDLLGTGTISAPGNDGLGSLLEMTESGKKPIDLGNGETRAFLQDGDDVILRAHARRLGAASIGFGDVRGRITPAQV